MITFFLIFITMVRIVNYNNCKTIQNDKNKKYSICNCCKIYNFNNIVIQPNKEILRRKLSIYNWYVNRFEISNKSHNIKCNCKHKSRLIFIDYAKK